MDAYGFDVSLTPAAWEMLRPGEALVLDWHRMAVCCAGAGEVGLYAAPERGLRGRGGLVRLRGEDPVYVARAIFPTSPGARCCSTRARPSASAASPQTSPATSACAP